MSVTKTMSVTCKGFPALKIGTTLFAAKMLKQPRQVQLLSRWLAFSPNNAAKIATVNDPLSHQNDVSFKTRAAADDAFVENAFLVSNASAAFLVTSRNIRILSLAVD